VLTERDSDRVIDKVTDLRGRRRLGHERASHILEYGRQIDFLLIVPTYGSSRLLAARTGMFEVVHRRWPPQPREKSMGFGRGLLLRILGFLPIILLLASGIANSRLTHSILDGVAC
jgi:hypothetical protein